MMPNFFDFVLIMLIIACYFLSSLRGGSKQIFSLAVIIFSFAIAGRYYWDIGSSFPPKVFPKYFAATAGFVIVFVVTFGLLSFLGRLLDGMFKQLHFGGIDRIVSVGIGIIKGFILFFMTMIVIMINYPEDPPALTGSVVCRYGMPAAKKLVKLLPPKEQGEFAVKETSLREFWKNE